MSLRLNDIELTHAKGTGFEVRALDGVSLEVLPGHLTLVVGETGSGKSTLLRVAAGLIAPDRGSAEIDGDALDSGTARGSVGLVFQDPEAQLFADTVLDDVMFGPLNLGADAASAREAALEALGAVGLDPEVFSTRSPFALSGGEARRAAIAGVLAMSPRYLLLDEPSAGLDYRGRRRLKELVTDAKARAGVAVVTHTPDELLDEADTVVVLRQGRVAWSGPVGELLGDQSARREAGIPLPPVAQVQWLVHERCGHPDGSIVLDPVAAAHALAEVLR